MSRKESAAFSREAERDTLVKLEPTEPMSSNMAWETDQDTKHNVKTEQAEPATISTSMGQIFFDRGNGVPIKQENMKMKLPGPPAPNEFTSSSMGRVSEQKPTEKASVPLVHTTTKDDFTEYESPTDITYVPESALSEGLAMVKALKKSVATVHLGSQIRKDVWMREIISLETQGSPSTMIAVCGATGAGKSSILNAILDDTIVPTSGMRACTAVVTEISYHRLKSIDADVSFLSEAEWRAELKVLLDDLVDENGNPKGVKNLATEAGVAWSKVHAVYPMIAHDQVGSMTVDQIIAKDQRIAAILGTVKKISSRNSKEFTKEIAKYIDSKDQKRGGEKKKKEEKSKESGGLMALVKKNMGYNSRASSSSNNQGPDESLELWPLIKSVAVRCSSAALKTGAVLVDLPGTADANAARNSIAKDYMKKCDCIWILAPITRAVDDKTARDLMGDAFRTQLMNGNYDSSAITFIATKADDVSCSEVIRALNLHDNEELEEIEAKIEEIDADTKTWKSRKAEADESLEDTTEAVKQVTAFLKEYKEHLEALKEGEPYTPMLTGKKARTRGDAKSTSKKRKNSRSGKGGASKRKRVSGGDIDDDVEMDDSLSDDSIDEFIISDDDDDILLEESDDDGSGESSREGSQAPESDDVGGLEEEITIEGLEAKIAEAQEALKVGREQKKASIAARKEAIDQLSGLKKRQIKAQREKNGFCSLRRSEFSRDVLKEDFRQGLKDMDDAAAEERDPDSFDPTMNLRDYDAIDLPVFTASARDYIRIKGQVKGDGEPTCFVDPRHTGIPALQDWCHSLTIASRQRAARTFLNSLKTFANSVKFYVEAGSEVTGSDRAMLKEKWETMMVNNDEYKDDLDNEELDEYGYPIPPAYRPPTETLKTDHMGNPVGIIPRLLKEFGRTVDECVGELQDRFRDGLEEKCQVGAANAASSAVEVSDGFAARMHWATYRATLRRDGSWRSDLNEELVTPMTKSLASSWSRVFESDLFASFQTTATSVITGLIKDVEESCPLGLKGRARIQGETCQKEAKEALNQSLDVVKVTLQDQQKEVSRCLVPHVRGELAEAYQAAMTERGTGSVARQKAVFHNYIETEKDQLFNGGAETVMTRLDAAADAVGIALKEKLAGLAQKVEVSIAVLWEGAINDPGEIKARLRVVSEMNRIIRQVEQWLEAERMTRSGSPLGL